jgi:oxygen-dependent protoporphyrinogen oxidase
MAQPMVGGIYTADPEKLSLRATLPRFLDMELEHRSLILAMCRQRRSLNETAGVSGARYSLFLSFDKGMRVLTDALTKKVSAGLVPTTDSTLPNDGVERRVRVEICTNSRVTGLRLNQPVNHREPNWEITTNHGELFIADAVCLAVPSYVAASLLEGTNASLAHKLRQTRYASTATVNLAYRSKDIRHPLDGFGFVVPYIEKRSLIACTFSSVKFPGRAPDGHVLLRAFVGGDLQPEMFDLDEPEMIERVKSDLRELLGIEKQPLFVEVARWRESMPQYEVGHLDRIAAIETELLDLPRLMLAGNSYRGAGIPDCIRSGKLAAEQLIARCSKAH